MRTSIAFLVLALAPIAFGQQDAAGSKDYPGLTRLPGFFITEYQEVDFDAYKFLVKQGNNVKQEQVEGRLYRIKYVVQHGVKDPSVVQVLRNYQNALRTIGGEILFDSGTAFPGETTVRVTKGSSETWYRIWCGSGVYEMFVVEKQAMQQEVNAVSMARDITDTGRVALYGIYFDTGKAELKPESEPALVEIEKLLKQNTSLRVCIVGHTDMVADFATNMKLSQARAQAVVTALVSKYGIPAARLVPFGASPYAPVASNKTDEGRAKNRRVELVEIATK
jgi:outer membrane protein OmpA-like peptidoglycan-associated protein